MEDLNLKSKLQNSVVMWTQDHIAWKCKIDIASVCQNYSQKNHGNNSWNKYIITMTLLKHFQCLFELPDNKLNWCHEYKYDNVGPLIEEWGIIRYTNVYSYHMKISFHIFTFYFSRNEFWKSMSHNIFYSTQSQIWQVDLKSIFQW